MTLLAEILLKVNSVFLNQMINSVFFFFFFFLCDFVLFLCLQLQGFILHDYQEILKALSVLQFIRSEENEIQSRNRLCLTENLLYEALCSMNIALRTLGVRGEEVSRGIEIERTTDMCDAFNLSRRYVRDLELFRLLERVFNQMYTRFSMWLYS